MKGIILVALIGVMVSGPAVAASDIYQKWHTHHIVCSKEKPPNLLRADLGSHLYAHFTFQNNKYGKMNKLVVQRNGIQFPNFAKVTTYETYVRTAGVHWSKIESDNTYVIVISVVTQEAGELHNSRYTISRTAGTYTVDYFSVYHNGERKDHASSQGVCWLSDGKLF